MQQATTEDIRWVIISRKAHLAARSRYMPMLGRLPVFCGKELDVTHLDMAEEDDVRCLQCLRKEVWVV